MGLDPLLPPAADATESFQTARLYLSSTPNPATGNLQLSFELPRATEAAVAIYDCSGRPVAHLDTGPNSPGRHCLVWLGRDDRGCPVASGTYWAVLRTARAHVSREVLWVR
jgi:hypothetical protein